jgi:signal transduction histidine kinase
MAFSGKTKYMVTTKQLLNPEILRKFSCFASLSRDQLGVIADSAPTVSLRTNTVVFHQGARSETMYLILKGGVKIERENGDGEILSVGHLSEYNTIGELALLSKDPRQATVTTIKDTELLAIDRSMMLDIICNCTPEEILQIFSALSEQYRETYAREFEELLSKRTLHAKMEVEKQRALTQMVAGVAHEINTPLGIINTAVSIMARDLALPVEMTTQRAADIAESLELMRRNVERADRLVQDFKKVSVSQLAETKELIDISEVIDETLELIMVSLTRSQIRIDYQNKLTLEQNKWVGYRGFLSQILINLLTNVERYAYPHGVGGIVEVTLRMVDETQYCLSVKDHGKGIQKEDQARVFEPFFTTGRPVGGTGLGLTIVHNIVTNSLKGEIKLKSSPGKGSEFIVIFPREIPD